MQGSVLLDDAGWSVRRLCAALASLALCKFPMEPKRMARLLLACFHRGLSRIAGLACRPHPHMSLKGSLGITEWRSPVDHSQLPKKGASGIPPPPTATTGPSATVDTVYVITIAVGSAIQTHAMKNHRKSHVGTKLSSSVASNPAARLAAGNVTMN